MQPCPGCIVSRNEFHKIKSGRKKLRRTGKLLAVAGASLLITACGGGGSAGPAESATGIVSIAITAPQTFLIENGVTTTVNF